MKKQPPPSIVVPSEKLALRSETLRRMVQPIDDAELAEIVGGQMAMSKSPTTAC
jgi:hypothetical protein